MLRKSKAARKRSAPRQEAEAAAKECGISICVCVYVCAWDRKDSVERQISYWLTACVYLSASSACLPACLLSRELELELGLCRRWLRLEAWSLPLFSHNFSLSLCRPICGPSVCMLQTICRHRSTPGQGRAGQGRARAGQNSVAVAFFLPFSATTAKCSCD